MSHSVRPALTPEEWAERLAGDFQLWEEGCAKVSDGELFVTYDSGNASQVIRDDERHALAALALHGQPFGFTWEMVDALRDAVVEHIGRCPALHENGDGDCTCGALATEALIIATADRIAALLSPREKAE